MPFCFSWIDDSKFDLSVSYITRQARSDIVRKRTVVLQTKVCSGIIFAYKINSRSEYHLAKAKYNCVAISLAFRRI